MIKKILVSQPKPTSEKSPYYEIASKYGVELVFRPFIKVEGLTAKEFRLLDVLTSDADRIFSRQQLIDKVWGTEEYIDENTVAVTVARLREKLQAHGINNVVTVWGFGYKWQS